MRSRTARFRFSISAIVVALGVSLISPFAASSPAVAADSVGANYASLGTDWSDTWSYGGTVIRNSGSATFAPSALYSAYYIGTSKTPLQISNYTAIRVVVSGASLAQVAPRLVDSAKKTYLGKKFPKYSATTNGTWSTYTIPLSEFGAIQTLVGIQLTDLSGAIGGPFYIQSVSLVPVPVVVPEPEPEPVTQAIPGTLYSAFNYEADSYQRWLVSAGRSADAALLTPIVSNPTAVWLGAWTSSVRTSTAALVASAAAANAVAQVVLYNIPLLDCDSQSGGAPNAAAYRAWIDEVRAGLGTAKAIVIIEPDALAHLTCLSSVRSAERISLISYAAAAMKAQGSYVYVDAGNQAWVTPTAIAARLASVGVGSGIGFSLNVSNFQQTAAEVAYGRSVSAQIPGAPSFVIDVSRNGAAIDVTLWCNPSGARLGVTPTLDPGIDDVDGLLWIKRPGESDGTCNGGPAAGAFWLSGALALASP